MTTHAEFGKALMGSDPAVQAVATWLRSRGHEVEAPEPVLAPEGSDRSLYYDEGDLFILGPTRRRFEAKGSSRQFTGPMDYPHPRMIICETIPAARWTEDNTPEAIFIVSRDLRNAIIVLVEETRQEWFKMWLRDGRDGILKEFWMIYPSNCPSVTIGEQE